MVPFDPYEKLSGSTEPPLAEPLVHGPGAVPSVQDWVRPNTGYAKFVVSLLLAQIFGAPLCIRLYRPCGQNKAVHGFCH